MKFIVIVLSIALFLSATANSIREVGAPVVPPVKAPAPAAPTTPKAPTTPTTAGKETPYNCDAHNGVRMEAWNTKTKKLARAMLKNGRTPQDVCLIPTGEVYDIETGALADNLKKRLCKQNFFVSYVKNILRKDRLIFSSVQNPGPISTHTGTNFCSILYANYFFGSRLREFWDKLDKSCKRELNPTVAKALSRRFK